MKAPTLLVFIGVGLVLVPLMASVEARLNPDAARLEKGRVERDLAVSGRPSSPAAGVFLVAESHLHDANFSKTVVLILQHGAEGSLGLIVNRPTATPLTQIWPDLAGMKEKDNRLFIGGPVMHNTFGMLYRGDTRKNHSPPIFENVYYSNNSDHLLPIAKGQAGGASDFRVYAGYAGWAPGQLQAELQRGDWKLVGGYPEAIFEVDPDTIWSILLAESERQWI